MIAGSELRRWLTKNIAAKLGLEPDRIDPDERLALYGLDSLAATGTVGELAGLLKRELAPTLIWDYPTINELTQFLMEPHRSRSPVATRSRVGGEPVAIIGMACRFPQAPSLAAYWRLLLDHGDAITEIPPERWAAERLFHPDPTFPGKMNTKVGGFLSQVDRFEPQFFGISPREAIHMDPQQRIMLELSWEALEDAGVPPRSLCDSRTGVFVGAMWSDYARVHAQLQSASTQHTATGQDLSILSARISYTLGLRGPSLTVNTACSSALVAVHLARQSLQTGECTLAIAGGINLILSPDSTIAMTKFGGLSPAGRCKSFAAGADGYVRSEGGGAVILKPLARALADGDRVYAVIRGSVVNNDGYSNGLTAPSRQAQELMLQEAYANAGVDPQQVQFVETHGTGTMLGDPIEASALGAVLGAGREPERALLIGAVKSNLGHLEPAAGVAGLIKTALALHHRLIPPNLHFTAPNPHIDFAGLGLRVPTKLTPWPAADGALLAGVSSFGFGGTNSHVVLEKPAPERTLLLPLAADSSDGLRALAGRLREVLVTRPEEVTCDELMGLWPWTCHGAHRLALTGRAAAELLPGIDAFLSAHARAGSSPVRLGRASSGPVLVLSGTGSQWQQMGRALLQKPVLRASLQRCEQALRPYLGRPLLDTLLADDPAWLDDTELVQPAIFMVQVGLVALVEAMGIEPAAVLGQSTGEVAAAYAAGCLTLEEAARIVCIRSRILHRISGQGAMAVIDLAEQATERLLSSWDADLAIAGALGPQTTALTGPAAAVHRLLGEARRRGVGCRPIRIAYASHSRQIEPLLAELRSALGRVESQPAIRPLFLASCGAQLDGELLDGEYFAQSERRPMQFAAAFDRLVAEGYRLFVEVSPHPLLVRSMQQCLGAAGQTAQVVPLMHRHEPLDRTLRSALGVMFTNGISLDWQQLTPVGRPPAALLQALGLAGNAKAGDALEPGRDEFMPVSAHSPTALMAQVRQLAEFLAQRQDVSIKDLYYTLSQRRSHHQYRLAVIGATRAELVAALESAAGGGALAKRPVERVSDRSRPPVVFVFPGQGTQWATMAIDLLTAEPVFRQKLLACAKLISQHAGWSLLTELARPAGQSRLDATDVAQPALFAVEVALAALLGSWGLTPDGVVGHSVGEVAAAHIAGLLDLEAATRLVCRRGQLMHAAAGGRMLAVALGEAEARQEILGLEALVGVAAVNAPGACVLAGEPNTIQSIRRRLKERAVHCQELRVNYAFHSPQMDPVRREFEQSLELLPAKRGEIPLFSSVLGAEAADLLDVKYWGQNLRQTVRFAEAIAAAAAKFTAPVIFVEVGPHPALSANIEECLAAMGRPGRALPTLWRQRPGRRCLLESLATLYAAGYPLRWSQLSAAGGQVVSLPGYPWQRERYWLSSDLRRTATLGSAADRADDPPALASAPSATMVAPPAQALKVQWQPVPSQVSAAQIARGPALLLRDHGGTAELLMLRLQKQGVAAQLLEPSACAVPGDLAALLSSANFSAIVHLCSLDGPPADATTPQVLEQACQRDCGVIFQLLHALTGIKLRSPVRLLLVTRGVHGVDSDGGPSTMAASLLWGLGRTLVYEHPELNCTRIDLSMQPSPPELDALADLVLSGSECDELTLRGAERLAAQLTPAALPLGRAATVAKAGEGLFRANATYLLTGGLGSLGGSLAAWMVEQGARHLVLLGRRGAGTTEQQARIADLRGRGAEVTVVAIDVADLAALEDLFDNRLARLPELRGVVHLAGVMDGGLLVSQGASQLTRLMQAKVQGAWNLHLLTRKRPLDFFVLYSSIAALLGAPGLGIYAGVNSFLDTLAHYRRRCGLPALSINWGPFADLGLLVEKQLGGWLAARGMYSISAAQGCEVFGRLLDSSEVQLGYLPFDGQKCSAYYPQLASSYFYAKLLQAPAKADSGPDAAQPAVAAWLSQAEGAERQALLTIELAALVKQVLHAPLGTGVELDAQAPLGSLGMDSLMLLELRHLIRNRLGIDLPLVVLVIFKEMSIAQLSSRLAEQSSVSETAGPVAEWENEVL